MTNDETRLPSKLQLTLSNIINKYKYIWLTMYVRISIMSVCMENGDYYESLV